MHLDTKLDKEVYANPFNNDPVKLKRPAESAEKRNTEIKLEKEIKACMENKKNNM
jgi:hypothetical protein